MRTPIQVPPPLLTVSLIRFFFFCRSTDAVKCSSLRWQRYSDVLIVCVLKKKTMMETGKLK